MKLDDTDFVTVGQVLLDDGHLLGDGGWAREGERSDHPSEQRGQGHPGRPKIEPIHGAELGDFQARVNGKTRPEGGPCMAPRGWEEG